MKTRRHDIVEPVVRTGYAVEHLPDSARVRRGIRGSPGFPAALGHPLKALRFRPVAVSVANHGTKRLRVVKKMKTTLMMPFMVMKATPTFSKSAFRINQFS